MFKILDKALLTTLIMTLSQHAATQPREADPSEEMEALVIQNLILCQGPPFGKADRSLPVKQRMAYEAAMQKWEKESLAQNGQTDSSGMPKPIKGNYIIHSVRFTEVLLLAGYGFGGVFSYAPQAKLADMTRLAQKLGIDWQPDAANTKAEGKRAWRAVKLSADEAIQYSMIEGSFNVDGAQPTKPGSSGFTLTCSVREPTPEEMALSGVPSEGSVAIEVGKGLEKDASWVDWILNKGSPEAKVPLANYRYLNSNQIQRLLDLKDSRVSHGLIENTHISLSSTQLQSLVNPSSNIALMHALIARYIDQLNPEQLRQLSTNPAGRSHILLIKGGVPAVQEFRRILLTGDDKQIDSAMRLSGIYTHSADRLPLVDVLLKEGSGVAKERLSMGSKMVYTPEQIRKMLLDPSREVRIGVLRRSELSLPADLVSEGLSNPDKDLSFWYQQRKEGAASAQQLEAGLSDSNASTRAGWVMDKRYSLSPAQIERALKDPADHVVRLTIQRHDVPLQATQLDACLIHTDPSVRMACVARPDFKISYERWLTMLGDWNGNIWRSHIAAHSASTTLGREYLNRALKSASSTQLLTIANASALDLSAQQINAAATHSDANVRDAFCRRYKGTDRAVAVPNCNR